MQKKIFLVSYHRREVFLSRVRIRQVKAEGPFFHSLKKVTSVGFTQMLILAKLMERQFCLDRLSDPDVISFFGSLYSLFKKF